MPDRIHQLKDRIAYETARGVHTYTMCPCGRMGTRSGKCAKCLHEELTELLRESRTKSQEKPASDSV